jgi:hypothetical protein
VGIFFSYSQQWVYNPNVRRAKLADCSVVDLIIVKNWRTYSLARTAKAEVVRLLFLKRIYVRVDANQCVNGGYFHDINVNRTNSWSLQEV